MKGDRVIISSALRLDVLSKIHAEHHGIQKFRERAKMEFGGQASANK